MFSESKKYIRTDLACESGSVSPDSFTGASYERESTNGITTERLTVNNETGSRETGKEMGTYVTVSSEKIKNHFLKDKEPEKIIANEIKALAEKMMDHKITPKTRILVAGLGNRHITADALGPRTADKINATFHVKGSLPIFDSVGCSEIAVIHPGVLGQTGIESSLIVKSAAAVVSPHIVIVIDALAARSSSRLVSTIQLSDTGLSPGSGIKNSRLAVNEKTVGCPVMSIGVPTVVNSATLIWDALEKANVKEISHSLRDILEKGKSFFVSPKDCDLATDYLSDILSRAVNSVFGTADF